MIKSRARILHHLRNNEKKYTQVFKCAVKPKKVAVTVTEHKRHKSDLSALLVNCDRNRFKLNLHQRTLTNGVNLHTSVTSPVEELLDLQRKDC